jgi:glycosyltransferase involved in cell wall biosynthesis
MKVLHVAAADTAGGAARAAVRLHRAMLDTGLDSTLLVRNRRSDVPGVESPMGRVGRKLAHWRSLAGGRLGTLLHDPAVPGHRSLNLLPSPAWRAAIDRSDADVVNLHWVAGETMSIEDIGLLRKPVVWTLHDMWAFCGAEHVAPDTPDARWRTGYRRDDRPAGARWPDLDRWTWRRKRQAWTAPMRIVCPSSWLADCAKQSALMRGWPVFPIPNVLQTEQFVPRDRAACRAELGLPQDATLVLFGAWGGTADPNKGFDLLQSALRALAARPRAERPIVCVVVGTTGTQMPVNGSFPTHWVGHVGCDEQLAKLYAAVDVTVVPSRIENLPQMATEALSSGCPVAGFRTGGMPEVVVDRVCGTLADPYDAAALADGIAWIVADPVRHRALSQAARQRALSCWSASKVLPRYLSVYESAIADRRSRRASAGRDTELLGDTPTHAGS